MSPAVFAAIAEATRVKWPRDASGLPQTDVPMSGLLQALKAAAAEALAASGDKLPNALIKDLFHYASRKGAHGTPAFIQVQAKSKGTGKSLFALRAVTQ